MPLRLTNPAPEWLKLADVDRATERLERGGPLSLQFPSYLEGQFHTERAPGRRRQLTFRGIVALAIYDLFLIVDYLTAPQILVRACLIRLGIVTPLVVFALLLQRGRKRVLIQELCAVCVCAVAAAASLALQAGTADGSLLQAESGVLLMLIVVNTLLRPDFRLSTFGTILCYLEFLVFLVADRRLPLQHQIASGGSIFCYAALCLAASYALSREQRFAWLQQLRGRIQHRMLTDSNRELFSLSFTDQLTGLPNRAAYEKQLAELWQQAIDTGQPLAAIMVDVDHFKSINDSFGHLYGDRVLQRVAKLLEEALRAEADFVARFGGEEFVVLLPGTSLEAGCYVAERIRTLVEIAGSPAPIRGGMPLPQNTRWSTVSCGIAAFCPRQGNEASALIDAADAALYTAKQTGRNRVCISEAVPAQAA